MKTQGPPFPFLFVPETALLTLSLGAQASLFTQTKDKSTVQYMESKVEV